MGVLRTKSIEQSIRDTEESEHRLRKDLSAWDLTVFGIGVIIGTGIFVLTGIASSLLGLRGTRPSGPKRAGPLGGGHGRRPVSIESLWTS